MELLSRAEVTSTTNLGSGVIRGAEGRVVFVSGAVEGDIADVAITKKRSSYGEGRITRLITPSPHRTASDCTCFDLGCGGCTHRHVSYEHELAVKADYIKTAMKKCGLDVTPEPFLTAGADAVRSKVTVPVSGIVSGYYERESHNIIPCRRCLLHDAETDELRAYLTEANVTGLHHITIRRASRGTMLILRCGSDAKDAARHAAESAAARYPFITSAWLESGGSYTHIAGDTAIYDTLAGCRFKISPDSFYQVNHAGAELLYRRAIEAAGLRGGEHVADLYCGTGTIGIAASKSADIELTGIEINESAVSDARENAENNGVRARFICGDAASYDGSVFGESAADCVFLDPPRAGCDKRLIAHLCQMRPERIVYVSCDPATLARDAARLTSSGYRVMSVTPVDMFPRTSHVECVALLSQ